VSEYSASERWLERNRPGLIERLFLKVIDGLLGKMQKGRLNMKLPDGRTRFYGPDGTQGQSSEICIHDYSFFSRVALHGEIGLGEAFMEGLWDSDDLKGVLNGFIENRKPLCDGNMVLSAISRGRNYRLHLSRSNSVAGSKENIAAHYDLSADFYRTFLDKTMTYSCGIFRSEDESLEDAQHNKIQSIIEKAGITSEDHVLEIGCGWGGFAIEVVKATGCRLTGITISKKQYDYAKERVKKEGLEDRIEILFEDYRTIQGSFDKIISIEMLEAVGHEHLGGFFKRCESLLKPDGLAVLQVITMPDARYDAHRSESNWIQKYIFPGGVLPSLTAMCNAMTAHSRLQVEHIENIGIHYAETLKRWRQRFIIAKDELTKMGFDRTLQRKWIYYFSICEVQFALRVLNDLQMVLTREGNRRLLCSGYEKVYI
jgi:cyclopropane-fatty-acyl-phospholipid synthase